MNLAVKPDNLWILKLAAPAYFLAVIALLLAVRSRQIVTSGWPADVQGAIRYIEGFDSPATAKAAFLKQWHMANEATRAAVAYKSRWLGWSTNVLMLSVVLLFLPIMAVAFSH